MNNIAKYSKAKKAKISLIKKETFIFLTIKDDGHGFDSSLASDGNGLDNMKQRCEQLQGSCEIISATGHGTTIQCKLPITIISHSG